jgi:hypothetical protein
MKISPEDIMCLLRALHIIQNSFHISKAMIYLDFIGQYKIPPMRIVGLFLISAVSQLILHILLILMSTSGPVLCSF